MKLRSALLAATVLAAPMAAKAQAIDGLYIGAGAGANFVQDTKISAAAYPARTIGDPNIGGRSFRYDTGFVGVASIGYGLGNGLRFEIEGGYRTNDVSQVRGGGALFRAGSGSREEKYTGMFNVLYEFDPSYLLGLDRILPFPINPYIGVGAGYAWIQQRSSRLTGNTGALPGAPGGLNTQLRSTNGDGSFAYQAIIGSSFPIAALPGLSLTVEYRFLGTTGSREYDYQYLSPRPVPVGTAARALVRQDESYNHSVLAGVRYAFNAAPPPVIAEAPPPQPQREAPRTYLVFFDWDRADLTDRARQIIAEAAQATTRTQVTRIMVNGYTDTSGTARYNQGLSVRRAQNVAAELVRQGVPRDAISTQGFGETNPLVSTGDGVREPQNRRVQIILQ